MKDVTSKSLQWEIKTNGLNIYTLRLNDLEGSEQIWVLKEQLEDLKDFLNSLDLNETN
jgi:hypothetical protein